MLCYSAGAKNLRTFHEAAEVHGRSGDQSCALIRLSYYGGGHYDSIHKIGTFDPESSSRSVSNNQEKVRDFIVVLVRVAQVVIVMEWTKKTYLSY